MTKELTREYVAQVFQEEAARVGADPSNVIGGGHAPADVKARRKAVQRIHRETEAAVYRIAKVWGADHTTVARCLDEKPEIAPYDQATYDRFHWQYGFDRAVEIVQGFDHDTNADLAKWRSLGERP